MKYAEARRQMKRDEVQAKTAALPEGKFSVLYVDPPWQYGDGRGTG
jgi:16S rRNA G966 N2-methylase RsmD